MATKPKPKPRQTDLITKPAPPLKIKSVRAGELHLSGPAVADAVDPRLRREFIDRCFAVPTLRALRLNGDSLRLRFQPGRTRLSETMDALAAAMKKPARESLPLACEDVVFSIMQGKSAEIYRVGQRLTFWRIEEEGAASYRCFHPLAIHPAIRGQVLEDLSTLAGVEEESALRVLPGAVVVRCQPQKITPEHLLDVLDPAIQRSVHLWDKPPGDLSPYQAVVNTHAILAPISDYLLPQFRTVSTLLLSLLTFRNVRRAVQALRSRRVTMSVVHAWMGALGLITLHFTGDALMTWLLEHWPKRVKSLSGRTQRRFLSHYRRYPRRVWVDRGSAQAEVAIGDLRQGDLIVLRHGDTVPCDGLVVDGTGTVRENWITGGQHAASKRSGEMLYASSRLTGGELRMRLTATGGDTVAARLASWYAQVFTRPRTDDGAKKFADRLALPALVMSVASLSRGGIPMAKAAAHPDYLSGPSLTAELGDLTGIIQSGLLGIYISSSEALTRIAAADCFVVDDSAATWRGTNGNGETLGDSLRRLGVGEVVLLSHRPADQIARMAKEIGADVFHGDHGPMDKAAFISQRRYFGHKVAYFGGMGEHAPAANSADVSIAVAESLEKELPDSHVVLRQPDLENLVLLRLMGIGSMENRKVGLQVAFSFNLTCAAAALFLNFPILAVVVLTNFSTFLSYLRSSSALKSAVESADED